MSQLKIILALALALVLALAASSCGNKAETESQQSGVQGYGEEAPPADQTAQAPPAEQPPAEPAPPPAPPATKKSSTTKRTAAAPAAQVKTYEIPAGTLFDVAMVTPMSTKTSNPGDRIEGRLVTPIIRDGYVVADTGAVVRGEVMEVVRASRAKSEEDRASLKLAFTSIQTVEGEKQLHATVTNSEGKLVAKGTGTRDKLLIAGGTVLGAIAGRAAGKDTKSTVIGAVGGAVVGTGVVMAAKGHELEIPEGSKVSLRVDQPIVIVSK